MPSWVRMAQRKDETFDVPFSKAPYQMGELLTYNVTFSNFVDAAHVEMFVAERGKGAFLNDRRLRVAARTELGSAVIGTGIPHSVPPRVATHVRARAECPSRATSTIVVLPGSYSPGSSATADPCPSAPTVRASAASGATIRPRRLPGL